ncbi:MAG: zinc ribbon domain-containing protein [Actinomycetota bacterium]|nr:zinc ribbon domain-containing protein [Actinomycetota bacterium]
MTVAAQMQILAAGFFAFFKSGTWDVVRNLLIFFAVVFWIAVAVWVYKDARRRIEDPWLVAMATILGLIPPFLGALVYLLLRPPEYLEEARERELEIKAMEERLSRRDLHCPVCRAQVEPTYLVCPVCTTKLKQSCANCKAPLDALWQMCPYCETPVDTPTALELGRKQRLEKVEKSSRRERRRAE